MLKRWRTVYNAVLDLVELSTSRVNRSADDTYTWAGQPGAVALLYFYTWYRYSGYRLKGALNPNFLNLTKNREKFCL